MRLGASVTGSPTCVPELSTACHREESSRQRICEPKFTTSSGMVQNSYDIYEDHTTLAKVSIA